MHNAKSNFFSSHPHGQSFRPRQAIRIGREGANKSMGLTSTPALGILAIGTNSAKRSGTVIKNGGVVA